MRRANLGRRRRLSKVLEVVKVLEVGGGGF